jgi:hypothetical protein
MSLTKLFETTYWQVYSTSISASDQSRITSYIDQVVTRITNDFDLPLPTTKLILWIDPSNSSGVFGTPTPMGAGVFMGTGIMQDDFWFHIAVLHETVNYFTGTVASDWVWADGSPLWGGSSPFPNACDILMLMEMGYQSDSNKQYGREYPDSRVALFYNLSQKYGWGIYQRLFKEVEAAGLKNWGLIGEPQRTATLIAFMNHAAGNGNLLNQFQQAGIAVKQSDMVAVYAVWYPNEQAPPNFDVGVGQSLSWWQQFVLALEAAFGFFYRI